MTKSDWDLRFNEAAYLHANPDVEQAIDAGTFASGRHHWDCFGYDEGRPLRSLCRRRPRREKLLGGIDVARLHGLEIGALAQPIVRKAEVVDGGSIRYVDHADTAAIHLKYHFDGIDHSEVVDVDLVWGERSLAECLGSGCRVDYVVNSHVVEHVPDLVTWLAEIHAVLEPHGHLRMAIPDRRFTFDVRRRESSLAEALDAAVQRPRRPGPRPVLDHFLHVAPVDAAAAWRGTLDFDALLSDHTPEEALIKAERVAQTDFYQDTHCWVFTPLSFAGLCADIAAVGRLELACVDLYPTEYLDLEFLVAMRPAHDRDECVASWRAMEARLREIGRLSAPRAPL